MHLLDEFIEAWERGERPEADQFAARHVGANPPTDVAVQLALEELCQRQERGEAVETAAFLERFPHCRAALSLFLKCHQLIETAEAEPVFPEAGQKLGEFHLCAELGRGARGRVFLAEQPALSDRPVVVKLTPLDGGEHLSLARLQHSSIVPLYLVQDLPEERLRVLCMPALGGASLERLLQEVASTPVTARTGRQFAEAIERLSPAPCAAPVGNSPALATMARASYPQAVVWLVASLADGLEYAAQRGLVHLDVKPSNILVANDGQPMLLDFHLARGPVCRGESLDRLGGTPGYMSPEQETALDALRKVSDTARQAGDTAQVEGDAAPQGGDAVRHGGRSSGSDLFSLGVVLYEALGGPPAAASRGAAPPRLRGFNKTVSRGLEEIVHKCLAAQACDRYADAGSLASDLRRHLCDQPLRCVPNRSLPERWVKWRRRKPHAATFLALVMLLLAAVATIGLGCFSYLERREAAAAEALVQGRILLEHQEAEEAIDRFDRGLASLAGLPGHAALRRQLDVGRRRAHWLRTTNRLHVFVEQMRFLDDFDTYPADRLAHLEAKCGSVWAARAMLLNPPAGLGDAQALRSIRRDLLDLVVHWTMLATRTAPARKAQVARRQALNVLEEAASALGRSAALERERARQAEALGWTRIARQAHRLAERCPPRESFDHYAVARSLVSDGDLEAALGEFERAAEMEPSAAGAWYGLSACAQRLGRHELALRAAYACTALAPNCANSYYQRGLAFASIHRLEAALHDFRRALELDPALDAARRKCADLTGASAN